MSSYTTQYSREAEKIRNNEREWKYDEDPDYKEHLKKRALERYYRMKKQNWMHHFLFLDKRKWRLLYNNKKKT